VRARLVTAAKIALGLALIAWLLGSVDWGELAALARAGDPAQLALSVGAFVVAMAAFQALRLHVLVRRYTGSLSRSYKLFFVGALFNNLLPSNVGGDAVRLLYLRRMGDGGWGGPLSLLMVHRLSGIAVLLVAGAVYVLLRAQRLLWLTGRGALSVGVHPTVAVALAAGAVAVAALALLALTKEALRARLRALVDSSGRALGALTAADWVGLLLLTVAFHAARLVGLWWAAAYFGEAVDAFDLVFVLAVTAIVALLPISIAGLGVVEGSISFLLVAFGVGQTAAISAALINRAVLLLMALAGAVVYIGARDELSANVAGGPGAAAQGESGGGSRV
jgi:hypothetical protein